MNWVDWHISEHMGLLDQLLSAEVDANRELRRSLIIDMGHWWYSMRDNDRRWLIEYASKVGELGALYPLVPYG